MLFFISKRARLPVALQLAFARLAPLEKNGAKKCLSASSRFLERRDFGVGCPGADLMNQFKPQVPQFDSIGKI
jgi:hypothetical protein